MKTILVDAVNTFVIKDKGVFIEMYQLLEKYPNRKIVVTNANDEQIGIFSLNKLPYELFTLENIIRKKHHLNTLKYYYITII